MFATFTILEHSAENSIMNENEKKSRIQKHIDFHHKPVKVIEETKSPQKYNPNLLKLGKDESE